MQEENLEQELDAALARYADSEPREGLEQRVLASLRAQRSKDGQRWKSWRAWSAVGLASVAVAGLLMWAAETGLTRKAGTSRQRIEREVATTQMASPELRAQGNPRFQAAVSKSMGSAERVMAYGRRPSRTPERAASASRKTMPRLAQFPAPEPLTEQERLLTRFVEQSPEEAALFAEVRAKELQREADEASPLGDKPDSQQNQTYGAPGAQGANND